MTPFTITHAAPASADLNSLLDLCFGPGRLARTAERLRESNRPIADYSHHVHDETRLLGAISFWPIAIAETPGLLLGPLAVHPDMQGRGLGLALMQTALEKIDAARFDFILLVGDLPYYQRAGFQVAPSGVRLPGPVDPERLLVRPSHADKAAICAALSGAVRPTPEMC